jgi:hypothetical protein
MDFPGNGSSKGFAAPLAVLAFWVGMLMAAHAYPAGYDWRYQTVSVLLYPDHNPRGYVWAWAGLELCGLAGVVWTASLIRRRADQDSRPPVGLRVLQLGFIFICCALLPDGLLPWPRLHETLAILAFLGLCIGVMCRMWATVAGPEAGRDQPKHSRAGARRARVVVLLPLFPLLLAGATQAWLALARPNLPWVNPGWRTLGISPLLSFGLWEWISCAVFSACLLFLWSQNREPR